MKNIIRQRIIDYRNKLSRAEIVAYSRQFLDQFVDFFSTYRQKYNPQIIGGYVPIKNEFDIGAILDYCRSLGLQTALPFCHGKDTLLTFHAFDGNNASLEKDYYNIPAPSPKTQHLVPDFMICPSVGVCKHSHRRLGYGGGFYDRYSTQYPQIHCVGGFIHEQIIDHTEIFMDHDLKFYKIFILN